MVEPAKNEAVAPPKETLKLAGKQSSINHQEVVEKLEKLASSLKATGSDLGDLQLSRKSSIAEEEFDLPQNMRKQRDTPITRICLTGGPCAGKTTALVELQVVLNQMGFRVLQVPEAATILMKGGALIQSGKMNFAKAVQF